MEPKINPTTTDKLLGEAKAEAPQSWASANPFPTGAVPMFAIPAFTNEAPKRDPLRPEKAAIIGTAPSSRLLAPFGDPSWTIWGSSPGNAGFLPRVDAWFEIHNNFDWPEYKSYGEPYVKWLNEQTFPIMAQDTRLVKNARVFPKDELIKEFGKFFFTSTFAWMMAYAIYVGVKEIGLYGVDMASKDEYIKQRPGGQYFIQMALSRGIAVVVPNESDLMQPPPLYGYADSTPFGRKLAARELEIRGRITEMEQQANSANAGLVYLRGAAEDIDYVRQIWGGVV